jgi:NADH dehydrogenase
LLIGGGASGVELAGELADYARKLARWHNVDSSLISIDLLEAMPRILSTLPEAVSRRAEARLRALGVNVHVNRSVVKEDVDAVYLKDMHMNSKTIIWTAGMKGNSLAQAIQGLPVDKRGRVEVDAVLRVPGYQHVYVIGDAASTKYSGMAQTALADAAFIAKAIEATLTGKPTSSYTQPAPAYAVPVGPKWAAVVYHGMRFYGLIGWLLRRAADFRAFLALLPLHAALRALRGGETELEWCEICAKRSSAQHLK